MLSDNFVRRVMLDALRSGVPARHNTFCIEHEDRVVRNALNEMPELTFALVQLGKDIPDFLSPLVDTLFQRFVQALEFLFGLPPRCELALARLIEARVIDGNRCLCCNADQYAFGSRGEHAWPRVAEKQT